MARTGLFCHQTAQQVQLVRCRDSDQQIGGVNAGLQLGCIRCAVTLNAENIQILGGLLERGGAAVNDGDVMTLARELLGKGTANFAIADDHNFHQILS